MLIFVASPRDLQAERDALRSLVEELNAKHGFARGTANFLELVDWHAHVAPLTSLPDSILREQLPVSGRDLFLGIGWLRFDGSEDEPLGPDGTTATERDFEIGFGLLERERRPSQLFLRCLRAPESLASVEGRELARIESFFGRFGEDGTASELAREFQSAEELRTIVEEEIERSLKDLPRPRQQPTTPGPTEIREFERRMEDGQAYDVSFLSIEAVEDEALLHAARERADDFAALLDSLRRSVVRIASEYGGEIFSWDRLGGLVLFWRKRHVDHATMSGLKILHNLPVFNLDTHQNPIGAPVEIRVAAHDAVVVFHKPAEKIQAADLDLVVELQKLHTTPNELTITERFHERVDQRLRPHFKFKGRFSGEPVYACRLPSSDQQPKKGNVDVFLDRARHQVAQVREALAGDHDDLEVLDALGAAVNDTYSTLNKFCSSFASIDSSWSSSFFRELSESAETLAGLEQDMWSALRSTLAADRGSSPWADKLEAVVQSASRRRSRPVVILEKLRDRASSFAAQEEEQESAADVVDDQLLKKIDAFVRADDLDNQTTLTDLLLNHKTGMLQYIRENLGEERCRRLLDHLWKSADLVLLDDLFSIRDYRRAQDVQVFDVLVNEPVSDARFLTVRSLLDDEDPTREGATVAAFSCTGHEPSEDDRQIAWRCIVVGHTDPEVRTQAAFDLTPQSMWQVVSHPSIPIATIQAIGERVAKREDEDAQKIFFDCTRSRIEAAAESFRTRDELSSLTKLILLLLDFSFLVEGGYFERFDEILRRFLERAQKAGLKVEYFENLRRRLDGSKREPGKDSSKPPAGLKKLPLTLQRLLAAEARYVQWFVSHPDPRIANETLRHIGLSNVERVLRTREINGAVMAQILRKPELFTRSQAILLALNHPKCDQQFANRYVASMTKSRPGLNELKKLSNNPSANPMIRSVAKRAVTRKSR